MPLSGGIASALPTPAPDDQASDTDPSPALTQNNKPAKLDLIVEAKKRGILPPDKQGYYDEALKRGLLPGVSASDTSTSPAPYKEVGSAISGFAKTTADEVRKGIYDMEGRDRAVDYGPGAGFTTEAALKEADNPAESRAILEKIWGKGNAGQDRGGNWWIKKDGKRVAVFGDDSSLTKRVGTSAVSSLPQLGGMTGGEMVGTALGTAGGGALGGPPGAVAGGTVGGAIGTGIGGAIGKGWQDLGKWAMGVSRKTPKEEEKTLGKEAAFDTGGGLAGKTLTRLGGYLLRPKEIPWVHVTPEMEKRTTDALAHGMVPTVEQATGGKAYRLVIFDQKLNHYIWGDPTIKGNVEALNKQLVDKLQKAGVPANKIQSTMDHIIGRDVPTADINHDIVQAVTDYREGIEKNLSDGSKKAADALNSQIADIDKSLVNPKVDLSERVADDITKARKSFSDNAGGMYQTVDELAGGRKLVESGDIKSTINSIIEKIPKTEGTPAKETMIRDAKGFLRKQTVPAQGGSMLGTQVESPTMAYIRDMLKLPDKLTLSDAQRIRSSLLELTRNPGLTPGVGWKELQQIAASVDNSIDAVALNEEDKPVIDALRTANAYYKDGIEKFKDVTANNLVKEAGQRDAIEPEKVMDAIIKPGKVTQAQRIMGFLQPDTKHQLARDYFQSIMQRAANPTQPSKLGGARLLNIVNAEGDMMKAVLGNDAYNKMLTLAKNTAALGDDIPVSSLGDDGGAKAVKAALETKKALDTFMDEHYLSYLAKPGSDADTAFDYITKPGRTDRLKAAMSLFGQSSPIASKIKQKLMAKILASSVGISDDPEQQLFAGNALKKTLTKYGREYLTEAYGKDMTDDLFKLADTISVISGKSKMGGAVGFVAGAHIMLGPLKHLSPIIEAGIMNQVMSKPWFLKWLILGIKGDSTAIKTVHQMMLQATNMATQGAIPNKSEESPADQKQDALQPQ